MSGHHNQYLKNTLVDYIRCERKFFKAHNQSKIIKKSKKLFWLFNMATRCEHDHRRELQKSFKFWVAVATLQVYLSVIPVFFILNCHACPKLIFANKKRSSSLYGHVAMDKSRSQHKNTDFV